jgi:hypothetical protein
MARPLARRDEVEPIGQAIWCRHFSTLAPEQRSLRRSPDLSGAIDGQRGKTEGSALAAIGIRVDLPVEFSSDTC